MRTSQHSCYHQSTSNSTETTTSSTSGRSTQKISSHNYITEAHNNVKAQFQVFGHIPQQKDLYEQDANFVPLLCSVFRLKVRKIYEGLFWLLHLILSSTFEQLGC